jgi:pimeloyl-ACP methyl ester carboxylesterase
VGAGVQPETRYAWLGQDRIAYQVFGQGPPDLVLAVGVTVDVAWEDPGVALWLRALASFSRLIFFDRRGSGPPTLCRPIPCRRGSRMPRNWTRSWTRSAPSGQRS